ncbi:MAG: GNAT family N-acetyltransferase [Cryomorphaceae bacterium]|nr:GNAT family N-acetyltransferase [Cryomorphaceae bacterium]
MNIQSIHSDNLPQWAFSESEIIDFLFKHLEQYGDPKDQIQACMDFAMKRGNGLGGFGVIAYEDGRLLGATIINHTGMKGYIPANILVYIAVDGSARGKGIGKKIMTEALKHCDGGVALHVESDNPARHLYENLGFTNKYLEMRWQQ